MNLFKGKIKENQPTAPVETPTQKIYLAVNPEYFAYENILVTADKEQAEAKGNKVEEWEVISPVTPDTLIYVVIVRVARHIRTSKVTTDYNEVKDLTCNSFIYCDELTVETWRNGEKIHTDYDIAF